MKYCYLGALLFPVFSVCASQDPQWNELLSLDGVKIQADNCQDDASCAERDKLGWRGEAEFGGIVTSGNTSSTSFKTKIDITHNMESWRNRYVIDSLAKTDEVDDEDTADPDDKKVETTAERYFGSLQGNYKLDTHLETLFVYGAYEKDRFAGFSDRAIVAAGWGRRWFESDNAFFDLEFGPGYQYERTTDSDDGLTPGESSTSAIARVNAIYNHQLSANVRFRQTLSSDWALEGGNNSNIKAETSLTSQIYGSLAMKAAFLIKHNTRPEEDKVKTDTETSLTLVYSF